MSLLIYLKTQDAEQTCAVHLCELHSCLHGSVNMQLANIHLLPTTLETLKEKMEMCGLQQQATGHHFAFKTLHLLRSL